MKIEMWPLLSMVEEKLISVDIREQTTRGMWKSPDWTWPAEQTKQWEVGSGGGRQWKKKRKEKDKRGEEEPRAKGAGGQNGQVTEGKAGEREANLRGLERVRVWGRRTERSQNSVEGTWDAEVFGQGLSPLTHVSWVSLRPNSRFHWVWKRLLASRVKLD